MESSNDPTINVLLRLFHIQGTTFAIEMDKVLDENPEFKKKYNNYIENDSDPNGFVSNFINQIIILALQAMLPCVCNIF